MKFYIVTAVNSSGASIYQMRTGLQPARGLMKSYEKEGFSDVKMLILEVNDDVLEDTPPGGTASPGLDSLEVEGPVPKSPEPKEQPKDDKSTKAFYGYPLHDIIENLLFPHYNKPNLPVGVLALALFGSKYSDKVLDNMDSVSHTATMLHRLIVAFSKATTTIGSVTIPNSGTIEVHLQPDDIDYGMSPAMNQIAGMQVVNKVVVTEQMMNTINGISDEEFNLPFGVKLADLLPLDAAGSQDHIWDYIKGNTALFDLFPAVKN